MLGRLWLVGIMTFGCAHRIEVDSSPAEAQVYGLNSFGLRAKLIGRTPLRLTRLEEGMSGIEVESPGHLPQRFMIPFAGGQDLRLNLKLQKLDAAWIQGLPPETLRGAVDSLSGELFAFQSDLFASSPDEAVRLIETRGKRLAPLGSFHEIVGNYWFYSNRYMDAAREFSRVLELDPKNEEARKMLVLTDVKSVNKTILIRNKAFVELRAAAGEIALQASGYIVKTRSQPNLPEPDGFEIILPSDLLFRPTTARFNKVAVDHLRKLASEFSSLQQGLSITVEAHTDSDMSAELENSPALVVGGHSPFKSLWELSSNRAAAVMEFLRNENVLADRWNIAGYADTRPLRVADAKNNAQPATEGSLNRRIVIRVQLLGSDKKETVLTQEEAKRVKQRLAEFLVQDVEVQQSRSRAPRVPVEKAPVEIRKSVPAARPMPTATPVARNASPTLLGKSEASLPSESATQKQFEVKGKPAAKMTPAPEVTPTSARPRLPRLSLPGG